MATHHRYGVVAGTRLTIPAMRAGPTIRPGTTRITRSSTTAIRPVGGLTMVAEEGERRTRGTSETPAEAAVDWAQECGVADVRVLRVMA
jgi:hypothetical protein